MTDTTLKLEINSLPKEMRNEVAGFVEFLKTKPKLKAREFGFAKGKIKQSPTAPSGRTLVRIIKT
ncbi:hypothetical protein SAMN04487988_101552 [Algoriphagus hitonicola]|uniref:DUF2281 domain-containing protein n=1 Tax=Algoriphagus hitonicola TaxID=435880 RepID=A0A1I2PKN1_9BACT|nr:hypothetical protein SAMN04487988_101552 [Algoriphagus hitonicola]